MKKTALVLALTAATLPILSSPVMAIEPLDPRAMSMGGHYTAYPNSDVNGTLVNPALLQYQRGFFYLGPNLGFGVGNNAVSANPSELQSLVNYGQYIMEYFNYSTSTTGGTVPTAVALPSALQTVKTEGLTVSMGLRTGLVGLKLPFPSILGVQLPAEPLKPVTTKPKAPVSKTASASVLAEQGLAPYAAASGSLASASLAASASAVATATGSAFTSTKMPEKPVSLVKKPEPPRTGGLAWGAMGVRGWLDGRLDLNVSSPVLFGAVTNFPTIDQALKTDIKALKDQLSSNTLSISSTLEKVNQVRADLASENGFGAFVAKGNGDTGARSISFSETNRAYATVAGTLTQPIPFPTFPMFPKARATVGGSFKVFGAPGTVPGLNIPTAAGSSQLAVGAPGKLITQANINISSQLAALDTALSSFSGDISKMSELGTKMSDFGNLDFQNALSLDVKSRSASNIGTGVDLGTVVDLSDELSLGASVQNALVVWPGTEANLTGKYDGKAFSFTQTNASTNINFTDTEPMALCLGATYRLPGGFNLVGDFQNSFETDAAGKTYGPSLQAGLEWNIFNFLYARGGARIGGKDPIYGAGLGLNLFVTKVDLAVAVDPQFKSASLGASFGVGF